jgi:hypothetical protein
MSYFVCQYTYSFRNGLGTDGIDPYSKVSQIFVLRTLMMVLIFLPIHLSLGHQYAFPQDLTFNMSQNKGRRVHSSLISLLHKHSRGVCLVCPGCMPLPIAYAPACQGYHFRCCIPMTLFLHQFRHRNLVA